MFCSLDSVDIVYTAPDGRERWMQTDHRRPAQIEAEPELSVLFALIRLLDPPRHQGPAAERPVLEYRCQHHPPEFLRAAIAGAGAELIVSSTDDPAVDRIVPYERIAPDPEVLGDLAFAALAARIISERDLSCDLVGLDRLELSVPQLALATDELAYWRTLVELAAVAGEAIRAAVGGHWRLRDHGTLPFLFLAGPTAAPIEVDPLDKAMHRIDDGPHHSLVALVAAVTSAAH